MAEASFAQNKGMVLSALSHKVTYKFRTFCKTELMDRFLYACMDYFRVFFELQKQMSDACDEVAKTERLNLYTQGKTKSTSAALTVTPLKTLAHFEHISTVTADEKARRKLRELAAIYATILVQHTNYSNTQQERQFFETLYDFSARVLFTINDRKRWHTIENELGRIFRSEHFNLSTRKNEQHVAKPVRCKEMYEMKQQDDPLVRKEPLKSIHTAMHLRSPVISTLFPTPKEMLRATELQVGGSLHTLFTPSSHPSRARGWEGAPGCSPRCTYGRTTGQR